MKAYAESRADDVKIVRAAAPVVLPRVVQFDREAFAECFAGSDCGSVTHPGPRPPVVIHLIGGEQIHPRPPMFTGRTTSRRLRQRVEFPVLRKRRSIKLRSLKVNFLIGRCAVAANEN